MPATVEFEYTLYELRSFRDAGVRGYPADAACIIVSAGDMSWGDEPDGRAYLALKELFEAGVTAEMGIL
jgi:hypothetical protein